MSNGTAFLACDTCDDGFLTTQEALGPYAYATGAKDPCPDCGGSGRVTCSACGDAHAVVEADHHTFLCAECRDECARLDAEFAASTLPPPVDQDDALSCDDVRASLLTAALAESIELAQDCRAAGIPAHEGFRLVRRAVAR